MMEQYLSETPRLKSMEFFLVVEGYVIVNKAEIDAGLIRPLSSSQLVEGNWRQRHYMLLRRVCFF